MSFYLLKEDGDSLLQENGGHILLFVDYFLTCTQGIYTLTGKNAILLWFRQLYATTGYYLLTGYNTTVTGIAFWIEKIVASTGWRLKGSGH